MSTCEQLTAQATAGVAPALRAVDCLASESTASAFARLFGDSSGGGTLLPALTVLLTLYIAFFALSLLTGRSRIGISALTPRMMTLGLVLTFATSWMAYQTVVWNLAVGAPDQIAGVLTGSNGSATQIFADRIDILFAAVSEASEAAGSGPAGAAAQAGTFTPGNLVWLAALLLMLGTVGVLVTARIALAVLLAIGPVFVVMVLFNGTRGLFAGWLRGVVMTSAAPLFAVVGGGFMLELAVPVVAGLRGPEGIDGRAAMALFLVASVNMALMIMVMRVIGTIVGAWTVFGLAGSGEEGKAAPAGAAARGEARAGMASPAAAPVTAASHGRPLGIPAAAPPPEAPPAASERIVQAHAGRTHVAYVPGASAGPAAIPRHRPRGIGSRFRPVSPIARELFR